MEVGEEEKRCDRTGGVGLPSGPDEGQPSTWLEPDGDRDKSGGWGLKPSSLKLEDLLRTLQVVENDSLAIAKSFSSLFSSLRLTLSEATSTSVDHMHCLVDAAGKLQENALDAGTRGSRYINSCLRLNEEMKGIENLASQLKFLRRDVDVLDAAVDKLLRLP